MSDIDLLHDPIGLALGQIQKDYNVTASVRNKDKLLDKFGENLDLDTADGTVVVSSLGTNVPRPTTNSVTHIVGASGDTMDISVEGHYLTDDDQLVFVVQTATLTADTPVALTTPLARATRMQALGTSTPTGPVQVTIGSGGTAVVEIPAGDNQSQKCETSMSYRDFWIITNFGAAVLARKGAEIRCRIEKAAVPDGLWYPLTRTFVLTDANPRAEFPQTTPIVIPPNTDVRIVASTDVNDTEITAHIDGYLAADMEFINDGVQDGNPLPSPAS